jgi:hypothetical protein
MGRRTMRRLAVAFDLTYSAYNVATSEERPGINTSFRKVVFPSCEVGNGAEITTRTPRS